VLRHPPWEKEDNKDDKEVNEEGDGKTPDLSGIDLPWFEIKM
jgi:hypothetical protein